MMARPGLCHLRKADNNKSYPPNKYRSVAFGSRSFGDRNLVRRSLIVGGNLDISCKMMDQEDESKLIHL